MKMDINTALEDGKKRLVDVANYFSTVAELYDSETAALVYRACGHILVLSRRSTPSLRATVALTTQLVSALSVEEEFPTTSILKWAISKAGGVIRIPRSAFQDFAGTPDIALDYVDSDIRLHYPPPAEE